MVKYHFLREKKIFMANDLFIVSLYKPKKKLTMKLNEKKNRYMNLH